MEPLSRAPNNTSKRKKISKDVEDLILDIRDKYGWGKEKISAFLKNEYRIKIHHNTVNKYLHIHKKINPKLFLKNFNAFSAKKQRIRQARSRRIKRKEQTEALMNFIDTKLNRNKGLNQAKLQLINCQLCSVA